MSWTCPECSRSFKNPNQSHSCIVTDEDSHFRNKEPMVREIFDKLKTGIEKFGKMKFNFTKHAIIVSAKSTFLAVKPRKNILDIEFLLDQAAEGYPVYKVFRVSKNRVAHFVHLEMKEQVDKNLISLLKKSYTLINK